MFQVGVLEELYAHERFRHPKIFAGTSGGAINAALLAAGKTPRHLREFWLQFATAPPVDANLPFFRTTAKVLWDALVRHGLLGRGADRSSSLWWALKRMWQHRTTNPGAAAAVFLEMVLSRHYGLVHELLDQIPAPALLHGAPLRRMLVDALGGEQVPALPGVRLAVNAVDLRHCRPARFINLGTAETEGHVEYIVGDTIHVDMVLGSAAIPVLMPLVAAGTHRLWDGGLLVNAPLASAVSLEAEEIIPVLSNALPDGARELTNLGDTLQRLLDIITEHCFDLDRKLLLERNKLARNPGAAGGKRYREVKLYQALRPERNDVFKTGSYLDFTQPQLDRMYEQGRAAARSWLAAGPKLDELPPRPAPPTPVRG